MSDTPEARYARAVEIIAHGLFTILFEEKKAEIIARRAKAAEEAVALSGEIPTRRRRQRRRPPAWP